MKKDTHFRFESAHSGIYAEPTELAALQRVAEARGLAWCDLDLAGGGTKNLFLQRCAAALKFPAGFGHNWDALADCLGDLAWLPAQGLVVRWHGGGEFARGAPVDFSIALEIFAGVADSWRSSARCMMVLLDEASRAGRVLPVPPR